MYQLNECLYVFFFLLSKYKKRYENWLKKGVSSVLYDSIIIIIHLLLFLGLGGGLFLGKWAMH